MKTIAVTLGIALLLASQAIAAQQQPAAQARQRIQRSIEDFYIVNFSSAIGPSEQQQMTLFPILRQYVARRFMLAQQRAELTQEIDQLLAQRPSDAEVQKILDRRTELDTQALRAEQMFRNRVIPNLTPVQRLRVLDFQMKFFEETLPRLIEQARANGAQPAAPRGGVQPARGVDADANRR